MIATAAGCGGGAAYDTELAAATGLLRAGRLEEALAAFDDLRRRHPDEIDPYRFLASTALRLERPEAAIPALEVRVARGGGGEPFARLLLAQLLDRADRRRDAVAHLEQALALDPGYAAAYRELSRVTARAGDVHRAMEIARQGLERNPGDTRLRWWLGDALMRRQRWPEAEAELRRAIVDSEGGEAPPHYSLGLVYLHTGRLEEARAELRAATEIEPASPESWYQLAHVHERLGDAAGRDLALERFAIHYRRQIEEAGEVPAAEPAKPGESAR